MGVMSKVATYEGKVVKVVVNTISLKDNKSCVQPQQNEAQSESRQAPKNAERHGRVSAWSNHCLRRSQSRDNAGRQKRPEDVKDPGLGELVN